MSKKNITLIGAMADAIRSISIGEIPDMDTVEASIDAMISEKVNKTFITSLSAETETPVYDTEHGYEGFFCNGTPVVISERADGEEGADITYGKTTVSVGPNTTVFGGRHDNDTLTNSSITMNGGTVKNLFGGGLHKSHTVLAKIVMTGGVVTSGVQGGGASSFVKTCGCSNGTYYAGNYVDSPCVTDDASVVITGGVIKNFVYGGCEGIGYVKKANVKFGGTAETYYLTPGGSNGGTDVAEVTVTGGHVKIFQGINRGYEKNVTMTVKDGEIEKMYAGGETPFAGSKESPKSGDPSGTFEAVDVNISGGHIGALYYGGDDYVEITPSSDAVNKITFNIKDKSVIDANAIV